MKKRNKKQIKTNNICFLMNNPYNLFERLPLSGDNISHILSFIRPKHPLNSSIKTNFMRCSKCRDVVQACDGQIKLRYYTISTGCGNCGKIGKIICKYCPTEDDCGCDSDNNSWYSWFSF
jgi:hypothetical protein